VGGYQLSISERTKLKRLYMRWVPVPEIVKTMKRGRKCVEEQIRDGGYKEQRLISTRKVMERLDETEVDIIVREIRNTQLIADGLLEGIENADLSEAKLEVMLREYRKYADRALQLQGLQNATPQVVINAPGAQMVVIPEEDLRALAKKAAAEKKRLRDGG